MSLVVALDSGGTKTAGVVARRDGTVLGVGFGGPANAVFISRRVAAASLAKAVREALAASGLADRLPVPLASFYASAPGVPAELVREALTPLLASTAAARWTVAGDELSALVGALGERYGVVALAGTGSFAVGLDRAGRQAEVGGWGPLLGDEGSGYDIGLRALRAVVRASEGRAPETSLTGLLATAWRLSRPRDLVERVYRRGSARQRIAALARVVAAAAREGDAVAREILRQAGQELGELAGAVVVKLDLRGVGCPVALVGGVAGAGGGLQEAFTGTVRGIDATCRVVPSRFTPLVGALLLALEQAGGTVSGATGGSATPAVLANLEAAANRFPGLKYEVCQ